MSEKNTSHDELRALAKKAPEGPWFASGDDANDAPPHRGSGLSLVDTGRESDWPIARLTEYHTARYLAAVEAIYKGVSG